MLNAVNVWKRSLIRSYSYTPWAHPYGLIGPLSPILNPFELKASFSNLTSRPCQAKKSDEWLKKKKLNAAKKLMQIKYKNSDFFVAVLSCPFILNNISHWRDLNPVFGIKPLNTPTGQLLEKSYSSFEVAPMPKIFILYLYESQKS